MTAFTPSKFSPDKDSAIGSIIGQSPSPWAVSPLPRMGLCKPPAGSTRAAASPWRSDAKIRSQMSLAGSKAGSGQAPGHRRRCNAQDLGSQCGRGSFGRFSLPLRRRPPSSARSAAAWRFLLRREFMACFLRVRRETRGATPASRYNSFNERVLLTHTIRSVTETAHSVQPKSISGELAIWGFHQWKYTAIRYLTRKSPIFILMSLNVYILIAILTPSC